MAKTIGIVLSLACLLGCGPTHQEVADEYKARILEQKAAIVAAAQLLEASDKASVKACEDTTIPIRYTKYGGQSNTTIAMLDWLLHLDDPDHEIPFNLQNSHALTESLEWSSEPNPNDWLKDDAAVEGFREQFESVLAYEFLVLNVARNFIEPKVLSGDTFQPGSVDITMFVVSIDPAAVLCRASFSATTAERVTAHSFASFPDRFQANFAIRRSLFEDAEDKQLEILTSLAAET